MPTENVDHLARAKDYIAKGEDYYRKAASEIVAAQRDHSNVAIGRYLGRSERWVRELVIWHTSEAASETPFARVPGENERKDAEASRRVVRDRPEVIAQAITAASPEAQRQIATALVASDSTERSLKAAAEPRKAQPRTPKSIERKLSEAAFALWEVGELLLDHIPEAEERVRLLAMAEKSQQLAGGIVYALDSGTLEDEFRTMVEEGSR